ncbi:MAG TPA: TrmJ/YjtD family RNA methyltransferase [Candidatus Angelobacter sp.]|nr:TrmJ/YjtD family RNA methyltransferase [Candidatus Angelobacter sp.]
MAAPTEYDRLHVVMVRTRNPLNIGAAARAMNNFGFSRLRVVKPYEPSFREARSAVGASSVLADAQQYQSVAEAVADCTLVVGTTSVDQRDLQHPLWPLEHGSQLIRKDLRSGRVAVLFGSEKVGLSNEDLSHCHWLMRIPTREEHGSMNLGQAVAVCLYELSRGFQNGNADAVYNSDQYPLASAGELERITVLLLDALRASGYLKPSSKAASEAKVRRLVRRLNLPAEDAEVWLGIFRQIVWKVQSSSEPA